MSIARCRGKRRVCCKARHQLWKGPSDQTQSLPHQGPRSSGRENAVLRTRGRSTKHGPLRTVRKTASGSSLHCSAVPILVPGSPKCQEPHMPGPPGQGPQCQPPPSAVPQGFWRRRPSRAGHIPTCWTGGFTPSVRVVGNTIPLLPDGSLGGRGG